MTPEQVEMAKKLVACEQFRWSPGMMRLRFTEIKNVDYLKKEGRVGEGYDDWPYDDWLVVPDLMDDATSGALLNLLPTGFSIFHGLTIDGNTDFRIRLVGEVHRTFQGETLGEAIADALLSRWSE